MDAKKVAQLVGALLLVVVTIDFSTRLLPGVELEDKSDKQAQQDNGQAEANATLLSVEEMETLLAWSDIEPPKEIVQATVETQPTEPPPTPPQPKIDVHAEVTKAIAGDQSKRLLGDNLFTLRGIFFEREDFAVLEVENIVSKDKKYYRATLNESLSGFHLTEIGKNHVVIQNGENNIRLQMFKGVL